MPGGAVRGPDPTLTFNFKTIMKSKYLDTQVRRHQLVPAVHEGRAVNCPICLVSAGVQAGAGLPLLATEKDRRALLLVSDDAGLGVRLGDTADFAGLAFMQINDATNALRLADQDCPAVVLLDLDLPASAGWEAAERILDNEKCPSLLLLTGRTSHFGLGAAIDAGAVVSKTASPARLLTEVDEVLMQSDAERVDRRTRQRLLVRWLRPYDWTVRVTPVNRHWGINE